MPTITQTVKNIHSVYDRRILSGQSDAQREASGSEGRGADLRRAITE